MKHTFALLGMGFATFLLSSPVNAQMPKETKGTRHIKMTKIENGRKMELDTVFTGDDVFVWNGDTVNMFSHADGDSVRKKIIIHKRAKDGNEEDRFVYMNGPNMKHFAPMPPRPPMPHMRMLRNSNPGRIIDLNDPNILSYKKKNLSGGREKIEIIRKKSEGAKNMHFDFNFDDEAMVPEPPGPPMFMNEGNERKIIRKEIRVEEKNENEIEEETAPKENK